MKARRFRIKTAVCIIFVTLHCDVQGQEIFRAKEALEERLAALGNYPLLGWYQDRACALTGQIQSVPLFLNSISGLLKSGIVMGQQQSLLKTDLTSLSTRTFSNCTPETANISRTFSESVAESVSISMTRTVSEALNLGGTLSGPLGGTQGVLQVSGNKTWSAADTTTQTENKSDTIFDSISLGLLPNMEVDISLMVVTRRIRIPVSAEAILDGEIYPCFSVDKRRASDLLSVKDRTVSLSGYLLFDDANSGGIRASPFRPANCTQATGVLERLE